MPLRFAEDTPADDDETRPKVRRRGTRHVRIDPEAVDHSAAEESSSDSDDPIAAQLAAAEPDKPDSSFTEKRRKHSRAVRKNEIEYATAELVRVVQDAQATGRVVPKGVPLDSQPSSSCCCSGLLAALGTKKPKNPRRNRSARGTYEVANLWKLNAEIRPDSKDLQRLKSWRRRLCFLLEPHEAANGDIVIVYLSEKDNGQVHLAAMLGTPGQAIATVEELPKVELSVGRETQTWAVGSQKQYEIAFLAPAGLSADEDWADEVPKQLYPFSVRWTDASGSHQSVLASPSQDVRTRWVKQLQKDLQMLSSSK